jgi:cytochrome c556
MKSLSHRHQMRIVVTGLLIGTSLLTHAESNPEEIVKYRQAVMKSQAGHMAAVAAIVQGKVDYKDQLVDHVKALEATSRDIARLFPKDSDIANSKALSETWSNYAEFQKQAKDTQQKSSALAQAVAAGDKQNYGARFKDLQESCKGCHKDFRKKDDK